MEQPGEELQEIFAGLDDRAVVDYLIKDPEPFIRSVRVVGAICVPHPVRGTVSSAEWHVTRARNYIHVLKENMALLTEQVIANEGLFYRLFYLQRSLTAAGSLDDMLMCFHRWAHDLGLTGASLCLFPDRWRLGAPSNHTHLTLSRQFFEPLHIQCLGQEQHYLGPLNGPEFLVVLPGAKAMGPVAMSMPGNDVGLGVVLFTSRNANHYQQGQGVQLLHEIVLILPEFLACWIERIQLIYTPVQNAIYVI